MKRKSDKEALSEDELIGDVYESQLEFHVDEDGNRFEQNEEGQWCMFIMSDFN